MSGTGPKLTRKTLKAALAHAADEINEKARRVRYLERRVDVLDTELAAHMAESARHTQVKEADLVRLRVERDALVKSLADERVRRVAAERFLTPQQLHSLQTGTVTPLTVSAPPPVEPSLRTAAPGGGVPIGGDAA